MSDTPFGNKGLDTPLGTEGLEVADRQQNLHGAINALEAEGWCSRAIYRGSGNVSEQDALRAGEKERTGAWGRMRGAT